VLRRRVGIEMIHWWLYISKDDLETERLQCLQEGKDLTPLLAEFGRVKNLNLKDQGNQSVTQELLDDTISLPVRDDFPYVEPSSLEEIRAARLRQSSMSVDLPRGGLFDKVYGAWLGRVAGCLLGKPVETWRSPRLWGFLRETGQYPLGDYISVDVPEEILQKYEVDKEGCFIENVDHMPEDDDTNYTTIGLAVMSRHGRSFTSLDVANLWLHEIPILHTFTAERVAYRNLCLLIPPPASAVYRNPHREWIGAQIRADFWGYSAPGDPELASEYAWRDACVSHVKNGIYGEMWVAAMIATAFSTDDVSVIIESGLSQIPYRCRLAGEVRAMMKWREEGVAYDEAVRRIHTIWDENRAHDWCHTISNARIVALGLLWGDGDFGGSITKAVQPGFDTDCNGATVGSIMGVICGASKIPMKWKAPFNDTLETGVSGYYKVKIRDVAEETLRLNEA
jgi:ADP-ribosylglycohydrolase